MTTPARAGVGLTGGVLATRTDESLTTTLTDDTVARALTDDALASRLTDELLRGVPGEHPSTPRRPGGHLTPLIPAGHGVAALTTFLLAVLTAVQTVPTR